MRHSIPKSMLIAAGFAVAVPCASANALGSRAGPARLPLGVRASADTATGCLQKGDESGEYALTTKDGKKYGLRSSSVDLSKHVGHTVTVTGTAMSDLRHGWAITVHRAQGSEWPGVVVVLPPEAGGMLSRPLVYTALTRAQRHLSIVHASGAALARAVREVDVRPRRTRLAQLIAENAD